jgi:phosphatidyl-myo-inositol dimannoside synthase
VRFGLSLAAEQATRRLDWVFYTHLAIARVQQFVPAPVGQPFGVFLHGVEIWRPLPPSLRRILNRATVLVANSHFTATRIEEIHQGLGPITVCPLALPPVVAAPAPSSRQEVGPHAVLVVGRMLAEERYKGHDELLEAWPGVRARVPDATLVFAGEGDDERRLRRKAVHLGVDASVRFPGFVSDADLHALYGEAAVFAMPSRNEGFGLVYLEAMSHGLPCIGSTADAAREVIQDGVTGFLVHQQDRAALTDRLVRLLGDDSRRRSMGAAGRERLESRFSYPQFQERMTSLLETAFCQPRLADAVRRGVGSHEHGA